MDFDAIRAAVAGDGKLYQGEESYEEKFKEWQERDWLTWLNEKLIFPFMVTRTEDEEDAFFTDVAKTEPFRLGHTMKVLNLEVEDDLYGIILKVREGKKVGYVPLCDVEVASKEDKNYWPVREYASWFPERE